MPAVPLEFSFRESNDERRSVLRHRLWIQRMTVIGICAKLSVSVLESVFESVLRVPKELVYFWNRDISHSGPHSLHVRVGVPDSSVFERQKSLGAVPSFTNS